MLVIAPAALLSTWEGEVAKFVTITVNTPTGTMRVSTPEATVLDLVSDPRHGGGLSNIATIIGELLEDDKLDIDQLVVAADQYPLSVVQRTGWIIEHTAAEIGKDVDLDSLAVVANRRTERTLLSSSGPRRGNTDRRWRVVVNTEVESEFARCHRRSSTRPAIGSLKSQCRMAVGSPLTPRR